MLTLSVHVVNLDATSEKLATLREKFQDFSGALGTLSGMLIKFYGDTNFASTGRSLGDAWAPLKSSTVAQKNKQWPGRAILERTGTLKGGFQGDVTPQTLTIHNDVPYFKPHQLGTATGPGRGHNIPARKMLGVNEDVTTMATDVIEADVREKIEMTMGV